MPPPISRCGFSSFVPHLPTPSLTRLYSTRITPVLEANNWHTSTDDLGIEKEYKFKTFKAAWSFMNQVAEKAEEKDHHPEWSNVSNITSRDRVLPYWLRDIMSDFFFIDRTKNCLFIFKA